MPKLLYTYGLPASGKSTWARQHVVENPQTIRVNRDDLRLMLHEGRFSKGNEKAVTEAQHAMIAAALANGRDVVVDDTNLNRRTVAKLESLARDHQAELVKVDFTDVPLRDCIARDAKRERFVGEDVIRQMWGRYLAPPPRERTGKPTCVIVDVDGTLAEMNGRSPYAWDQVHTDLPRPMVVEVVRMLEQEHTIVVLSGRDGSCRDATIEWLKEHRVAFDEVYTREAGDSRPDWQIKRELFDAHVEPRYDPVLVIDDRQQVVDLWLPRSTRPQRHRRRRPRSGAVTVGAGVAAGVGSQPRLKPLQT